MFRKVITNKRFISMFLSVVMILSMSFTAYAASNDKDLWIIKKDNEKNVYLLNTSTGEKIVEAARIDEFGNITKVDLVDYANILNNIPIIESEQVSSEQVSLNQEISPLYAVSTWYTYNELSAYQSYGSAVKCTADVVGPATISYGNVVTSTEAWAFSGTLTAEAKKVIKGNVSFSYNSSSSTAANFGITFTVPSGKTGYVKFTPVFDVSYGKLITDTYYDGTLAGSTSAYVTYKSPTKLDTGFTDGIYALSTY